MKVMISLFCDIKEELAGAMCLYGEEMLMARLTLHSQQEGRLA
jgi:hypothetical protein